MKFSFALAALTCLVSGADARNKNGKGHIIITNNAPPFGISLTPVWVAVHNGSFDTYTRGEAVSAGLESLAEDGVTAAISGEFMAGTAGRIFDATIASPGPPGPRPIAPGETVKFEIDLDKGTDDLFFSYASMVVPSVSTWNEGRPKASVQLSLRHYSMQ